MKYEELPKPMKTKPKVDLTRQECNGLKILYYACIQNKHGMWAVYCPICKEYDLKRTDQLNAKRSRCANECYHRNLIGRKFGKLTPIKIIENNRYNGYDRYLCLCDCGSFHEFYGYDLIQKNITNCGCQKSYGEYKIKTILNENDIKYVNNKSFNRCRFPDTNCRAFFDFYINEENKFFVEFDGLQHTRDESNHFGSMENYVKTHNHDLFKNQWAWNNKIPMKRIPYEYRNELSLDCIMSNKFLITPRSHPEWYPPKDLSYPYFNIKTI